MPIEKPSENEAAQSNPMIMVVDDESGITDLWSDLLTSFGYQVSTFSEAVTALKTFQQQPDTFDLVISDLMMPDLDGVTLITRMQAVRPDIPAIIITGIYNDLDPNQADLSCAQAVLPKPVQVNELLSTVQEVLSKRP